MEIYQELTDPYIRSQFEMVQIEIERLHDQLASLNRALISVEQQLTGQDFFPASRFVH